MIAPLLYLNKTRHTWSHVFASIEATILTFGDMVCNFQTNRVFASFVVLHAVTTEAQHCLVFFFCCVIKLYIEKRVSLALVAPLYAVVLFVFVFLTHKLFFFSSYGRFYSQ